MYMTVAWPFNREPEYLGEYGELAHQCANFSPDFIGFNPVHFKKAHEIRQQIMDFCQREGFKYLDMAGSVKNVKKRLQKADRKGYNVLLIHAQ